MLFDRMIEVGVRVRFVFEREMPPFLIDRLESVFLHDRAEEHAVAELRCADLPCRRRVVGDSAKVRIFFVFLLFFTFLL